MKRIELLAFVVVGFSTLFSCSSDSEVAPAIKPTAAFTYEGTLDSRVVTPEGRILVAPAKVQFSNNSLLATEYEWRFGDGQQSFSGACRACFMSTKAPTLYF